MDDVVVLNWLRGRLGFLDVFDGILDDRDVVRWEIEILNRVLVHGRVDFDDSCLNTVLDECSRRCANSKSTFCLSVNSF
jgi:hypothetical protein